MKTNKTNKNRDMRSFQADEDVAKMLDAAVQAGQTIKDLVNFAVRTHGPTILREMAQEMRDKASELEKKIPGGKHS